MVAAEARTISRGIDDKVKTVDDRVKDVSDNVKDVDDRVKEVNEKVARIGVVIQQMAADMNRPSFYDLIIVDHECLTSLTGNELRADLRKWIFPPDPSVNYNAASSAHHDGTAAWCTERKTLAGWRRSGSLLWIQGVRTYLLIIRVIIPTNDSWIASWRREEYS